MANRAAKTAVVPMTVVAIEQAQKYPLIRDDMASRFLPARLKVLVTLARWRPVRRWMINATEKKVPGLWAIFLCRKRYIDDRLREAMDAGIDAVVILGAGFDTRAYRLPASATTPVYEVDVPENINRKKALLQKLYGKVPESVTLVPVDFETQNLADTLAAHGFGNDQKAFFIWEAVTQYLTEEGVRKTFDFLAKAHPGSQLVFTFVRKDFMDGLVFYDAEVLYKKYKLKRRLWHFGLDPDHVAGFLSEYGWREVEQPTPRDFTDRYLKPGVREYQVSEVERSVHAEKT